MHNAYGGLKADYERLTENQGIICSHFQVLTGMTAYKVCVLLFFVFLGFFFLELDLQIRDKSR